MKLIATDKHPYRETGVLFECSERHVGKLLRLGLAVEDDGSGKKPKEVKPKTNNKKK